MSWKNVREVNPGVKVKLSLVNPQVNLSMEQSALNDSWTLSDEYAHCICRAKDVHEARCNSSMGERP